ncbi:hypothetical protein ATY30_13420 [Sinorhizobium americanum]|nr:hypothetical protein ATY30_13420 [Sinorhizobium americanum]
MAGVVQDEVFEGGPVHPSIQSEAQASAKCILSREPLPDRRAGDALIEAGPVRSRGLEIMRRCISFISL